MPPHWVRIEHTPRGRRVGSNSPTKTAVVLGSPYPHDEDENHSWSWDYELEAGLYQLKRTGIESWHLNYVAAGTVANPFQIAPMAVSDRYPGAVFDGKELGILTSATVLGGPWSFRITANSVFRLETWAQRPNWANGAPYPANFRPPWRTIQPRGEVDDDVHLNTLAPQSWGALDIPDWARFGSDYPVLSNRVYGEENILFGTEDGGAPDPDWNDLTFELTRLSA